MINKIWIKPNNKKVDGLNFSQALLSPETMPQFNKKPPYEPPNKDGKKEAENLRIILQELSLRMFKGELFFSRINTTGIWDEKIGNYRSLNKYIIKGFADVVVLMKKRIIFFEAKSSIGSQSNDQAAFQYHVEQHGGEYYVIRSLPYLRAILNGFPQGMKPPHDDLPF